MKYTCVNLFLLGGNVAPLVGAWIEILFQIFFRKLAVVAPLVGAWIEITATKIQDTYKATSLLSWERGLKSNALMHDVCDVVVAPLVGAWIEIVIRQRERWSTCVAPLVGAWIEILLKVA